MLFSLVSGTYNRIDSLKAMIASVRAQIPRHIKYNIIIVDGGSTDGTLEWLHSQIDVITIEHGELLGAIKAFSDGARASAATYVIMANDDVVFFPNSIMRAISHLESTPYCGGVAFADNRMEKVGQGHGYNVLKAPAIAPDGTPVMVNYAQVGMFRRWLGEHIGWWGDRDPIMGKARTYGGDNYLSSRIWELGYSIDAVSGCMIEDNLQHDALREANKNGHLDSEKYYKRYPRGPQIPPMQAIVNPQSENLRVLVMPIYEARFPGKLNKEYGLSEALARVGLTWEIDFCNDKYDLPAIAEAWQPHILITQMHDGKRIKAPELREVRRRCPGIVIVNWNGDAHLQGLLADDVIEALREVDLQTVVNAAVLPVYEQIGVRAAYWQIGYKDPVDVCGETVGKHDVLFLGNCYNDERTKIAQQLKTLQCNVGIYGNCPGTNGNTHYDFSRSRALYENCKIAVSDVFPGSVGFVSNRLFQAMAAGAFVMQQYSPELAERNGFVPGEHYIEWHSTEDLKKKIKRWLTPTMEEKRKKIAEAGKKYVRANFNYDAQVRKLWDMI